MTLRRRSMLVDSKRHLLERLWLLLDSMTLSLHAKPPLLDSKPRLLDSMTLSVDSERLLLEHEPVHDGAELRYSPPARHSTGAACKADHDPVTAGGDLVRRSHRRWASRLRGERNPGRELTSPVRARSGAKYR